MNRSARIALFCLSTVAASHAATTATFSFPVNTLIPDDNPSGLADTHFITSAITDITDITVSVELEDAGFGWAGDIYLYLSNGTSLAVLLNRPGRDTGNLLGYSTSNISVTFDDTAATDAHLFGVPTVPSTLTGIFQPDARAVSPFSVLTGDSRSAFLSSFAGASANGNWTLFAADVASGGEMRLAGWSMTVTGVPEPSGAALLGMAGLSALLRRRRPQA